MSRAKVAKINYLSKDDPGGAFDGQSIIFDAIEECEFPQTLAILDNSAIIIDASGIAPGKANKSFLECLAEIGDDLGIKGLWVIDPLPRARFWATKKWGHEYTTTNIRWKGPTK